MSTQITTTTGNANQQIREVLFSEKSKSEKREIFKTITKPTKAISTYLDQLFRGERLGEVKVSRSVETERILEELTEKYIQRAFLPNNHTVKKETLDEACSKLETSLARNYTNHNLAHLLESLPKSGTYGGYAIQLFEDLQQEFNIQTTSQRLIAQKIVSAEIRLLSYQSMVGQFIHSESLYATLTERSVTERHFDRMIQSCHKQIQSGIDQLRAMTNAPMKVTLVQEQELENGKPVKETKKMTQEIKTPKQ